ncbi:MAG: 4-hydroxythreonine-4-phosphate dehydrogenase PdxA [Acidobacteria bacterium]|nr:4-hydroxythreonine-4-phosphate dehydrogenase PdxA [Acidobacteriota bacterium]
MDAHGPESADSLFARARRGEFDWVLALYHDQGLIAVKTAAFGTATNWTLGLPIIRTSVDHGTAFALAGTGRVDVGPLRNVVDTTLDLLAGPSRDTV